MKNADWLGLPLIMIALYGYLAIDAVYGKGSKENSVECVKAGGHWMHRSGCGGSDYCERGAK